MGSFRTEKAVWGVIVAGGLLFIAVASFAFSLGRYEKVNTSDGFATIPVAKLGDSRARFYKFEDGGKEIAFFAVKAPDNSYKTAFDACDACYRAKKGYEQQGEKLNCRNCNQKFAISRLGPNATGGCNPSYLPHRQVGNNISININDLKAGARFF